MTTPLLAVDRVSKRFGQTAALDGVSFAVAQGEFFTLLGPSGCGKSTTLRLLAGLEHPDAGEIRIEGTSVLNRAPYERRLGMVFQSYALFPHLSVERNVAYGLERRRMARAEIPVKVARALELVRLPAAEFGGRRPAELSGGQRQRVALARALVLEPPVLLLDEPLGAVDRQLRQAMQLELRQLHRELGTTFLYVTHDQDEALAMSDRIAVMHRGRLIQVGPPAELYERPRTAFVATFLGESNLFPGAGPRGGALAVRPERLRLGAAGGRAGVVADVTYLGERLRIEVTLADGARAVASLPTPGSGEPRAPEPGAAVSVSWRDEDAVELERE